MTSNNDIVSWQRMWFKRNKVWMALDKQNQPLVHNDKQLIKYQLSQAHEYWVHGAGLRPVEPFQFETTDPISIDLAQAAQPASPRQNQQAKRPAKKTTPQPLEKQVSENAIIIYTDGASSGNPGPAGIGAVLTYGGHRKEISRYIGHATNNIAELQAIQAALHSLTTTHRPVRLYTDSSYAIGVLTKGWKAKANQELIAEIIESMKQFEDIVLIKVKGHAGIEENERADLLATQAIADRPA